MDSCPEDPGKTEPGHCGCGVPDTDSDHDDIPDCSDGRPDQPIEKGDLNNDGNVDLLDLIVALQVLTQASPASDVFVQADADGDGKVGLGEAAFILEKMAGAFTPSGE